MVFTAVPRVRVVRAVQPSNAEFPMTVFGVEALAKVTVFNEVQSSKAAIPTEVTELGMVTLVSFVSPNAKSPMVRTPLPRETVAKGQLLKATIPMLVTELGMVTLVSFVPKNADAPMV